MHEHLIVHHFLKLLILLLQLGYYVIQPFVFTDDLRLLKAFVLHLLEVLPDLVSLRIECCVQLLVLELQLLVVLKQSFLVLGYLVKSVLVLFLYGVHVLFMFMLQVTDLLLKRGEGFILILQGLVFLFQI